VPWIMLQVWMIGETNGFKFIGPREEDDGRSGSRHSYQCEIPRIIAENNAHESAATHDLEHDSKNKESNPDDSRGSAVESKSMRKYAI
jgi:hypothetical protein